MAILIDENTSVLVQGITGNEGSRSTKDMLDYGTDVACGVTPGKAGQDVHGVPVYGTVSTALDEHPRVNTSVIYVPAFAAKDAALEAIMNGVETVVIVTENIPVHDTADIIAHARRNDTTVVGPSSIGIITPGTAKVGSIGGSSNVPYEPGRIGVVSKSGGMSSETAMLLKQNGYGTSTVVGIGGDVISGTDFVDTLELFENDTQTDAVVMFGEIGGAYEERAASYIEEMTTPVVAFITGTFATQFQYIKLGHAGAIVEGEQGKRSTKVDRLRDAGALVADVHHRIPELLEEVV